MYDQAYSKMKIFHHCSPHYYKQSNAVFLMGCYMLICHGYNSIQAHDFFKHISSQLIPFRDAGEDYNSFELSVLDCLRGLEKAIQLQWYNFKQFNYKEYEQIH